MAAELSKSDAGATIKHEWPKWVTHNPYNICTVLKPYSLKDTITNSEEIYEYYGMFNYEDKQNMKIGFYSIPATGNQWAFWNGFSLYTDPCYGPDCDHRYLFKYEEIK